MSASPSATDNTDRSKDILLVGPQIARLGDRLIK